MRGLSFPEVGAEEGGGAVVREGKRDQRKSVWSSEPEMRSSGVVERRAL